MTSKILPYSATVTAGGEQIEIREFGFGRLPVVAKNIASIISKVSADADGNIDIATALVEGGEDVMNVLAIAVGKPRSWFDAISSEEGIDILTAVIAVNKESFEKKLKPAIQKLTASVRK